MGRQLRAAAAARPVRKHFRDAGGPVCVTRFPHCRRDDRRGHAAALHGEHHGHSLHDAGSTFVIDGHGPASTSDLT